MTERIPTVLGDMPTNIPVSKEQRRHVQEHARALLKDSRTDEEVKAEYERVMAQKRKREG